MRRRRAIGLVAAAVVTLTTSLAHGPAATAQTPTNEASRVALGALGREAAALVALGAFGTDRARIEQAVGPVMDRSADKEALLGALDRADGAGADALGPLVQATPTTSPDVRNVLGRLSAADRDAAADGRPISIQGEIYLRGLDHLARYAGSGPRTPAPPDPQVIANALTTAPAPTGGEESGSRSPLLAVVGLVALAAVGGTVLLRRRSPSPTPPTQEAPLRSEPVVPPRESLVNRPSAASMHDLLDVSRRLTAAASAGNVDRLIVRHALDLVRGDGAAVLRVGDAGTLHPSAESHPDLLVVDELADSAIQRVAETGQTLVQASASDRAIRNVPAAIAAVPLVGGGRVLAVLVVVRRVHEPFSGDERTVLEALAPVAAAAMHTATQSQAAVETSLVDALTGTGNRRRFDESLQRTLDDGN